MSVDTFYFSADQQQALRWWRQPLADTSAELQGWRLGGRPTHAYLLDEDNIEDLLGALEQYQQTYSPQHSLSRICQELRDRPAQQGAEGGRSVASRIRGLFSAAREEPRDRTMYELGGLVDTYVWLLEVARQGPINQPIDLRPADNFLASYLTRWLPAEQAERYDASIEEHTLGPCLPPELAGLDQPARQRLQEWIGQSCLVIDARERQAMWDQLDQIPGFWEGITREVFPEALEHLRAVGEIARFAVAHDYLMLKEIIP